VCIISKIVTLEEVDSTNEYLKKNTELWKKNFNTVRAITQRKGRGRYERNWFSDTGLDLTFSTIYQPSVSMENLSCITLYAGLAVYRVLAKYITHDLFLKWPNDIYVQSNKLAGILCELIIKNTKHYVIIGIGVNVNSMQFPEEIKERSISMKQVCGRNIDIGQLLQQIISELKAIFNNFLNPIPRDILQEWLLSTSSIGSVVEFSLYGNVHKGKIVGIMPDGALKIYDFEPEKEIIYTGEVIFI
jgi:BirA family biotin operon repressor/biotin-[acetyl-CoA-carboxylase] ligase